MRIDKNEERTYLKGTSERSNKLSIARKGPVGVHKAAQVFIAEKKKTMKENRHSRRQH